MFGNIAGRYVSEATQLTSPSLSKEDNESSVAWAPAR